MEPCVDMFRATMYPTAAFEPDLFPEENSNEISPPWLKSALNPKNRVDSLDVAQDTKWSIDGCGADGTRLFATPHFARSKQPLRIDLYIPEQKYYREAVSDAFNSGAAISCARERLMDLPICRHLVRALGVWSANQPNFEKVYMEMPFGSFIVIESMSIDLREMTIHLVPVYEVELQWLSVPKLQEEWKIPSSRWPETIDISQLEILTQLQETITLVRLSCKPSSDTFVFKSTTDEVRFLYDELRALLEMETHPNIIPKPLYIVTKKCAFGGKVGVCGFIMEYHSAGTLRDVLWRTHDSETLSLRDRLRWAKHLVSALQHIIKSELGFYSDLKPTNILMVASNESRDMDILLIDFEQRCSWYSWSPPEVYYIEYIQYLARERPDVMDRKFKSMLDDYLAILGQPPSVADVRRHYRDPRWPWLILNPLEQERAQVFMLGKILWCLFEGLGSVNSVPTAETFREPECDQSFPEFRRTPVYLRSLIRRCTSGAMEWRGRFPLVVRKGMKLFPRGRTGSCGEKAGNAGETQEAARLWWSEEIGEAVRFIEARQRKAAGVANTEDLAILAFLEERPNLHEIATALSEIEDGVL
jgi:serine/threonine protein kinase